MATMTGKNNSALRTRDTSPGPSEYNVRGGFGSDTTPIKIVGRPKWKPLNENPGPGDYEANVSVSKPRTP